MITIKKQTKRIKKSIKKFFRMINKSIKQIIRLFIDFFYFLEGFPKEFKKIIKILIKIRTDKLLFFVARIGVTGAFFVPILKKIMSFYDYHKYTSIFLFTLTLILLLTTLSLIFQKKVKNQRRNYAEFNFEFKEIKNKNKTQIILNMNGERKNNIKKLEHSDYTITRLKNNKIKIDNMVIVCLMKRPLIFSDEKPITILSKSRKINFTFKFMHQIYEKRKQINLAVMQISDIDTNTNYCITIKNVK